MRGRDNPGWVLLAVAGLLAAVVFGSAAKAADSSCTEWRARTTSNPMRQSAWFAGHSQADVGAQACQSLADAMVGASLFIGGASRTLLSWSGVTYGVAGGVGYCDGTAHWTGPYTSSGFGSNSFQSQNLGVAECPVDACEHLAGLPADGGGNGSWSDAELCRTDDGIACKVERAGAGINFGGGWFGGVKFTGQSCGTTGSEVQMPDDPPDCVTGPKGQVCLAKFDKNCGTFNGEKVCLAEVPDDSCIVLAGGGALCVGAAGPKDSEGDLMPPDVALEEVVEGVGRDVSYYGPSSVSDSSVPVVGSPSSAAGAGTGGPPSASEVGEGFGTGPDSDEWDPEGGMGAAIAAVEGGSWFALLGSIAAGFAGSASCPEVTMSIEFLSASFDLFEAACGYMSPHYVLWTTIMQIAWGLLALRIFFSGGKD